MTHMVATYSLAEILEETAKKKKKEDKIAVLQKYDSIQLRTLLKMAFDENLEWDLPPGAPPYEALRSPEATGVLYRNLDHFKVGIKGNAPHLNRNKKDMIFTRLLHSIHEKDALLLIAVKDRQLGKMYKGITKKLIEEAYGVY